MAVVAAQKATQSSYVTLEELDLFGDMDSLPFAGTPADIQYISFQAKR